ncbi:MAG: FUSC family membrane protein [Bacteroidota bacterium]
MQVKPKISLQQIWSAIVGFFLGEYFSDAVRNTLAVVLPIGILYSYNQPNAAVGVGVGTLLISLTDLPGNRGDKLKTALLSNAVFFLTALAFTVSLGYPILLGVAFFAGTFALSMLSLKGQRASVIGTMAIILSTFILGLRPANPVEFSFYILCGGVWYYTLSLLQVAVAPYRSLHHALFESLTAMSGFMRAKADCYNPDADLQTAITKGIRLHVRVTAKLDVVRQLLLGDRMAMRSESKRGGALLSTARGIISLYEQASAIHYDYARIREILQQQGTLGLVAGLIQTLADRMEKLGQSFLTKPGSKTVLISESEDFLLGLAKLEAMVEQNAGDSIVSRRILENLQELHDQLNDLVNLRLALKEGNQVTLENPDQYSVFIGNGNSIKARSKQALRFQHPVSRFSLRLALCFLTAYVISVFLPGEKYSYWMLLTIVIVSRPRFAITWKRNQQRLIGTLSGVLIALAFLLVIKQTIVLLTLAAIFLTGFFAFNRIRYGLSVAFITPAVLMTLAVFHGQPEALWAERIAFTAAGCAITFAGLYLFPIWDAEQLTKLVNGAILANAGFLRAILYTNTSLEQQLARKAAHLSLAELSEALGYARSEPNANISQLEDLEYLHTINFRINGVITSVYLSGGKPAEDPSSEQLAMAALAQLEIGKPVEDAVLDLTLKQGETIWHLLLDLAQELNTKRTRLKN